MHKIIDYIFNFFLSIYYKHSLFMNIHYSVCSVQRDVAV